MRCKHHHLQDMNLRVYDLLDVTSRNPHYKTIKAARIPVGAGFGDRADEVVALMKGAYTCTYVHYACKYSVGAGFGDRADEVVALMKGAYERFCSHPFHALVTMQMRWWR